ncbi:insulinase family protein [Candidatus Magnetaquicoccus inordinatus]|uniref:insulinase family protein n=1 Tax=Candidatus Magnetaquicoccus inordinatus TaxID=2496818 RepID=UPI00102C76CD|nr:insulinase family protein [Candidatus Magnetaquicoccus inordinatus]
MSHPAFELLRRQPVEALNLTVEFYRHRVTGARHLHLATDDPHNAFLVAFLTVPTDSTGVAHILEHTALCGSQRYPVRDPFFMMNKRSLATFINAVTGADWTAYPFSSLSRKDFDNLMQVYLDAAFFPNLSRLDFAQEGYRIELSDANDPHSPLVYKGVVYNEMKGAMSNPVRALSEAISQPLFPVTTYRYNSGGDPAIIPQLTWEQLRAFHARHYHPSNAIFMTFGNISAAEHQATFQERVLHAFTYQAVDVRVEDEQRLSQPVRSHATYAMDGQEENKNKTYILMGWLLGHSSEQKEALKAQLLSGVLLDNSASPLLYALETSPYGSAPAPMLGLDASGKEMAFFCGLEGSAPEHADAVEEMILSVLQQVASEGVPLQQMEAVLHQLELSRREISGDGLPYGLHLLLTAMTPMLYNADPVAALALDEILEQLREEIKDPDFIKNLAKEWLLDNPHRVLLVMSPDKQLNAQRSALEQQRLATLRASMDEQAVQSLIAAAEELKQRQEEEDDPNILPKLHLSDIPADLAIPSGQQQMLGNMPTAFYPCTTNRLVYQQLIVPLPSMKEEWVDLVPLFASCLTEIGCGGRDYLQTQNWQSAISGGISARSSARGAIDHSHAFRAQFILSGKALTRNQQELSRLLWETFHTPRFDELNRFRELIAQHRAAAETRVTNNGHLLAMAAAAATLNPIAAIHDRWSGLQAIARLQQLDDALDDPQQLEHFAQQLAAIWEMVHQAPGQLMVAAEANDLPALSATLSQQWATASAAVPFVPLTTMGCTVQKKIAWSTVTTVHFCAKAYPAVPYIHPDAPALAVLGIFLKHGYLHKAIRERGGAYGSGAGLDSDSGVFRFFSYRDPRFSDTFADFDRSVHWLAETKHEPEALEQAILSVISSIDRPGSPAGDARRAFHDALHGRTPEIRRQFRQRILQVAQADLLRVAESYLQPENAVMAAVSNASTLAAEAKGWDIHSL